VLAGQARSLRFVRFLVVRISGSRGHLDRRHVDTRIASMWTP